MARRPKPIVLPENPVFVIPDYRNLGLSLIEEVAAREAAAHKSFYRRVNAFPLNRIVKGSGVPVYGSRRRKPFWLFGRLDQPVSDEEYATEIAEREARRLRNKFGVPTPARTPAQLESKSSVPHQGAIPTLYLLGSSDSIRGIFTTEALAVEAGLKEPRESIYEVYANGKVDENNFAVVKQYGKYTPGHGQSDPEYKELKALMVEPAVEAPAVRSRGLFGKRKKNA